MIKILDFYADWCGPCKMMDPIFKRVMSEYPMIDTLKINVDSNEQLTKDYNVQSIPTLIFMKDDVEVGRLNGFASTDAIKNVLNKII